MTLKITVTIDQDDKADWADLIGLLAKAYGRGELGITDLRIERDSAVATEPEFQAWAKKLVVKQRLASRKSRFSPPKRGTGAFIGLQIVASGVANMNAALTAAFLKAGLSTAGAGATLSKLGGRGYVRNVGKGEWKLTAKGEAVIKEATDDAKVEYDDSANN